MNDYLPMLSAATGPRPAAAEGLVVIDGDTVHPAAPVASLVEHLGPGDLVVLNDAATLPASLPAVWGNLAFEVRIAALGDDRADVALLGAGSWRMPTEDRPEPPAIAMGDALTVAGVEARVVRRDGRWATLAFARSGPALLDALYRVGRPVQYSYLRADLPQSAFRTAWATRPVASEMPSAGRPLTWSILLALRRRGVRFATLTHAAGLSSVDGGATDATLPLPEVATLPESTIRAIEAADRVVAVGTTVVRALEDAARRGLQPGTWTTELVLGPQTERRVVGGLLTNLHEPGESHFRLLEAFCAREALLAANAAAAQAGLTAHEFGDSLLVLPTRTARRET